MIAMSEIRNRIIDPRISQNPSGWKTQGVMVDGVWRITLASTDTYGTFCRPPAITSGTATDHYRETPCVFYLRYRKSDDATLRIYRGGAQIDTGSDWCAWLVDGTVDAWVVNPVLELNGPPENVWVEPLEHGCYTVADWHRLRELVGDGTLPTPWFDGDTYPR